MIKTEKNSFKYLLKFNKILLLNRNNNEREEPEKWNAEYWTE